MKKIINTIKICSFFGHSKIESDHIEIKNKLKEIVTNLIVNENYEEFWFGGFGDFNNLALEVVTELKNTEFPNIQRIYCAEEPKWEDKTWKIPIYIKQQHDKIIWLDMDYPYFYKRIYFRNCEMIKHSDLTIFYVTNTENSGAYKALKFAEKIKKTYINIGSIS